MATKNEKSKMHVKTGDHVVVIAGKDKGKTGKWPIHILYTV